MCVLANFAFKLKLVVSKVLVHCTAVGLRWQCDSSSLSECWETLCDVGDCCIAAQCYKLLCLHPPVLLVACCGGPDCYTAAVWCHCS